MDYHARLFVRASAVPVGERWSARITSRHDGRHELPAGGEQALAGPAAQPRQHASTCGRVWAQERLLCPNRPESPGIDDDLRAIDSTWRALVFRSTVRSHALAWCVSRFVCHAEGRGFESHHPLSVQAVPGVQATSSCPTHAPNQAFEARQMRFRLRYEETLKGQGDSEVATASPGDKHDIRSAFHP
jgi:hypothetical protein